MRTDRLSFQMTAVLVILGLAIGSFVIAAVTAQALYDDSHSGEKLQFLGSLLGSALGVVGAVAGALLIEEVRRHQERVASRAPLIEALQRAHTTMVEVVQSADRVLANDNAGINLAAERQRAIDLLANVDDALTVLDLTEKGAGAGVRSVSELLALHALRKALGELQPIVANEQRIVANNGPSLPILSIFYERVRDRAAALTPKLNHARNTLNR